MVNLRIHLVTVIRVSHPNSLDMATVTYIEQFFDNIEDLPPEVSARFVQIRDIDIQAEQLSKHTDKLTENFLTKVNTMSPEEIKTSHDEIQKLFDKGKALASEKIQLVDDTYKLVEADIRQLDLDSAQIASEQKLKKPQSEPMPIKPETKIVQKRRIKSENKTDKRKRNVEISIDGDNFRNKKPKCEPQPEKPFPVSSEMVTQAIDEIVVEEIAIGDPNEPTYCFCQKVSSGCMVCCDNPDCTIEWFHFSCVGLVESPKGQWFCANCSVGRKRKK